MRTALSVPTLVLLLATSALHAQQAAPVSLTIYNQNFALARTTVDLALKPGTTEVTTTEVTSQLEPDSVVLRDPAGKHSFSVVEQNYDAGIVNQDWLLQKYEGKTIDFELGSYQDEKTHQQIPVIKPGRILRASPPLVEVDGRMQFQLPGTPLFPATTDGLLLKPTLRWQIASEQPASFPAELSYITRGFTWSATYNLLVGKGNGGSATESMDLVGWVTMNNESGVDFPQAAIKLIAGNVARIQPAVMAGAAVNGKVYEQMQTVTQENFDDFHLYDLNRITSLRSGETKQIEFLAGSSIPITRSYEYEPAPGFAPIEGGGVASLDRNFNPANGPGRVTIVNEFTNSAANHLGVPMPAGRLRLYRRDSHGAVQLAGEAEIPHTPRNETVRFVTGDAFDIKGKRTQTDFHVDSTHRFIDESFSIEMKNQKDQPVTVHVIEHLNRAANWKIIDRSKEYQKRDAWTVDFPITIQPESTGSVAYTVHYTW